MGAEISGLFRKPLTPVAGSLAREEKLQPRIRERASKIWESEGHFSNSEDRWFRAELELNGIGGITGGKLQPEQNT